MAKRFYEVIVLGADLGPLLAAAILAKRGFRVLVLGCGTQDDVYEDHGVVLPRRPGYLAAGGTPIARRVFADLGLAQVFRRKLEPVDPRFQVVLPRARFDLRADRERTRDELAREFGDIRRPVEVFYERLDQQAPGLDRFLSEELMLPPEGFFERRRFQRASLSNPFGPYGDGADVWGDIPEGHPFRAAVLAQVRFASHADPETVTPMQVSRLHRTWLASGARPEGGPAGLRRFLLERIALHAGEVSLGDAVTAVAVRRGRAVGVRLARDEEITGAEHLICGLEAERLPELFGEAGVPAALAETVGACRPRYRRFTLNLVVRRTVIPAGMERYLFLVPEPQEPPLEDNLLFLETQPLDAERSVVTAEAFAREERMDADPRYLARLSDRIVARLRVLIPFLDRHLLFRSSPWMPPEPRPDGTAPRISLQEREARTPARMPGAVRPPAGATLGVTGLAHRVAARRLLLTGRDLLPGLGDEGVFLSAWMVARLITEKDPRRVRLRRDLGPNLELP